MAADQHIDSAEARVIYARLDSLVEIIGRQATTLEGMQQSMHVLTEMRTQQTHILGQLATGAIKMGEHETRLQRIERDMPGLKELRRWVVAGVLAGVGMMGTALGKLVILDIPRMQPAVYIQDPRVQRQQPTLPTAEGQR